MIIFSFYLKTIDHKKLKLLMSRDILQVLRFDFGTFRIFRKF